MSLQNFPTRRLGRNGPIVSAIGLGTMTISTYIYGKTDTEESYKALTLAADLGMTYWDTADIYLGSEELIGKWFLETGRRKDIFLATKFGAADPEAPLVLKVDSTPSYIRHALQHSLKVLKTNYIDLYYQHRVDPSVPIEIVIQTLGEFIENGTIKWIGLSECSAATMRRAKAVPKYGEKIVAVEWEYSPLTLDIEKNGILDAARELGVAVVAYSPLSRGILGGRVELSADDWRRTLPRFSEENYEKNLQLMNKFKVIAEKYNATTAQIILAWILAEHSDLIPIPGCRSRSRVSENAAAAYINLASEDIKALREICDNAQIHGERYSRMLTETTFEDSIPLEQWTEETGH